MKIAERSAVELAGEGPPLYQTVLTLAEADIESRLLDQNPASPEQVTVMHGCVRVQVTELSDGKATLRIACSDPDQIVEFTTNFAPLLPEGPWTFHWLKEGWQQGKLGPRASALLAARMAKQMLGDGPPEGTHIITIR